MVLSVFGVQIAIKSINALQDATEAISEQQ